MQYEEMTDLSVLHERHKVCLIFDMGNIFNRLRLTSYVSRLTSNVSREKGFTLIELLIVIALIGIVAAIAAPQFIQMLPGMRVKTATRQVMSKMLELKMKAVSENKGYQIVFTVGGNQYQIKKDGTNVETSTLPVGIIFDTSVSTNTDDGPLFSGNAVSFAPNGVTSPAGSIYLIPQEDKGAGRNDRLRAVSVNPTGRVKAWKYSGGWTGF